MYFNYEELSLYWIIDIEANGLQPTEIWCSVVRNCKTGEVLVHKSEVEFKGWYYPKFTLIGHNISSFDVPVLNRLWNTGIDFSNLVDTLILSYLYNPALLGGHSLDAWGERLKFPKGKFNDWSKFSEEMVVYCKNDVELTYLLWKALTERMKSMGFSELSAEIEHKIRLVIDEQQNNGFFFNRERAKSLRNELYERQSNLTGEIQKLFPPSRKLVEEYPFRTTKDGRPYASYERHLEKYGHSNVAHGEDSEGNPVYYCYDIIPFNIGSPKQRVERLLDLGWVPEKFTEKGFPKVDEEALLALQEASGRPEIGAMAEWLVLQGRASMIDTWLTNLGPDSRIHGRVLTCAATTRRCIHSAPNSANIPSGAKAKYGHECRALWGVEQNKGLCLVGADASGLETIGLLHYLNNNEATEILSKSKPNDVHSMNARLLTALLGREIDREWGAKTSFYAFLFGAYPKKLGEIVKGSVEDGEKIIEVFFKNVPGLKLLTNEVQYEWKTNKGRLQTIDGGFVLCPSMNAALNYRIQSLGTIVMKLTCILLKEEAKKQNIPFKQVGFIHDELQMETKEEYGKVLGELAVNCITKAAEQLQFRVPLTGSYKIGTSWDQTH